MIVTTKISLDLQRPYYPAVINAVQGDQNTRRLEISLYSGGTAWSIPEGTTVAMRYCKSDKTKGYYDTMPDGASAWSIQGNVITVLLAPQMLTVAGTVFAQAEMIQGSSVLATFTMQINVEENPAAGVQVSEDYFNWLQWIEAEMDAYLEKAYVGGKMLDPEDGEVFTAIDGSDSGEDTHTHSYTSNVTTAATCTTAGVRTYTCSCGDSYTEKIPATGHNYENGVCTNCGAADPDYEEDVTLSSISAIYTGGNVAVGTAVTDLTGITVTAHYSDGSTETVAGYILSGTIAEGSNTITVSYGGKTTTFTVTGEAETGGGSESEDFTGTENAFIRDGYYYVNPLTTPNTFQYDTYATGDTAHAVIQINNSFIGSQFDITDLSAGLLFANIPYLGNSTVAAIRNGTAFPDAEFGWATDYVNGYYRILIPMSVYEEAGSDATAAMYAMTERVGIKLVTNYEDYLYEVTDELIDGMTGTPSTTLTDAGYYTGFLTWTGVGINTATGIGVQCIPYGSSGYGELTYETYGIRITNRFQYCVPSTVDTSSLDSFKAYLKTRGIKFLCGTAKTEAT